MRSCMLRDSPRRLLSSADERTSLAAQVFLLNCVPPGDARLHDLVHSKPARRALEVVLHLYEISLYDETSETFSITYVTQLTPGSHSWTASLVPA